MSFFHKFFKIFPEKCATIRTKPQGVCPFTASEEYTMAIFDTHAHYDSNAFKSDRDEVLTALPDGGVGLVVNAAQGGWVKEFSPRRSVKKLCRWHSFSADHSSYAARRRTVGRGKNNFNKMISPVL